MPDPFLKDPPIAIGLDVVIPLGPPLRPILLTKIIGPSLKRFKPDILIPIVIDIDQIQNYSVPRSPDDPFPNSRSLSHR